MQVTPEALVVEAKQLADRSPAQGLHAGALASLLPIENRRLVVPGQMVAGARMVQFRHIPPELAFRFIFARAPLNYTQPTACG
jgi:hypothetical protein